MEKNQNSLIYEVFKSSRWQEAVDKANDKDIDLKVINDLCDYNYRKQLCREILDGTYTISKPIVRLIPKKHKNEKRKVYENKPVDRILLHIINNVLNDLFPEMTHENCKSYQKNTSTQKVVKKVSKEAEYIKTKLNKNVIGYKFDFNKYFDSVKIEYIDKAFDSIEDKLGLPKGTDPIVNVLRKYYHQDTYIDIDGKEKENYQSLKQGCAVASWLSNTIMYELDEYMSNKYKIYYRYSDDLIVIDEHVDDIKSDVERIISKYGITLNSNKVETLYNDRWFTFLGFSINGKQITLSKNRIKDFQKLVEECTFKNPKRDSRKAKLLLIMKLYEGDYSWATSCLGTINNKKDIIALNNFIMDSLRACDTKKTNIGGLGYSTEFSDKTILRGKGRNVTSNKSKIPNIDNYPTLGCLSNAMKINKTLFDTIINEAIINNKEKR